MYLRVIFSASKKDNENIDRKIAWALTTDEGDDPVESHDDWGNWQASSFEFLPLRFDEHEQLSSEEVESLIHNGLLEVASWVNTRREALLNLGELVPTTMRIHCHIDGSTNLDHYPFDIVLPPQFLSACGEAKLNVQFECGYSKYPTT